MSTVTSLCASSVLPVGWALVTGALAATAYSFLANDTVQQLVTATFEEFWTIAIFTLLSLCFMEYSKKKKQPLRKKMPPQHDDGDDDEASRTPGSQAGAGQKGERRHRSEVSTCTAQFVAAMESGQLLLAEASIERLERLQASAKRASVQKFACKGYAELAQAFIQAGQAEKAKRWFAALAGSMPKRWFSGPGAARQGEERARWQELDTCAEQLSELVRKCAREGEVPKAEGLLTPLVDFAPIVQPAALCCMNSVVSACAKGGHAASSEAWLTRMLAMGLCPDEASFRALINAYARQGDVAQAQGWLSKMTESLAGATVQSYNVGLVSQACGQMQASGATPCGLRPEAPEFQPPVRAGEGPSKLRAEAPEFEVGAAPATRQKTPLRLEAPSFQFTAKATPEPAGPDAAGRHCGQRKLAGSAYSDEWSEPAGPDAASRHWGQRKLAGNVYSDESWGLLRKTMSDLAEGVCAENSSLLGTWWAGTGEAYEVEVDGKALRATRRGAWGLKHFAIEFDSRDRRYWWGDAKKLCFDPEDFLSSRTEISWYRANDTLRRYPAFTWYKQADTVSTKPVAKEPARAVAKEAPSTNSGSCGTFKWVPKKQ